jgi:hypothetical protein
MPPPPPPDVYQSCQAYWANRNTTANSNDDINNVTPAASDVFSDVTDNNAAVADENTANANENAKIADFSDENTFVPNVDSVSVKNATTPYDNIMSAARCESAGWSVEPSNVCGINEHHKRWIQQVMKDDWGIQFPHKFQICAIHHVAFHGNQILYILAKTGSEKLAIPLTIRSLQAKVTFSMVPLVGLGSNQVKNSRNTSNLIKAYHLDENRDLDGCALWSRFLALHSIEADCDAIFFVCIATISKRGQFLEFQSNTHQKG